MSGNDVQSSLLPPKVPTLISRESLMITSSLVVGVLWNYHMLHRITIVLSALFLVYFYWRYIFTSMADEQWISGTVRHLLENEKALRDFLKFRGSDHLNHQIDSLDANNVQWINDLLSKIWPYARTIVDNFIEAKGLSNGGKGIEIPINASVSSLAPSVFVHQFSLGDKPPVISQVKVLPNWEKQDRDVKEGLVHKTPKRSNDIIIQCNLSYFGNCEISVRSKTFKLFETRAGVKDIFLQSKAQIKLHPLLKEPPFIGGISVTLLEQPFIQFDMMHLATIVNEELLTNVIQIVVKHLIVFPNHMTIAFSNNQEIVRRVTLNEPLGLCVVHLTAFPSAEPKNESCFTLPYTPHAMIRIGSCFFSTGIYLPDKTWNFTCSGPILSLNDIFSIRIHDSEEAANEAEENIGKNSALTSEEVRFHTLVNEWSPHPRLIKLEIVKDKVTYIVCMNITCKRLLPRRTPYTYESQGIPRPTYFPRGLFYAFIHGIYCLHGVESMRNLNPYILLKYGEVCYTTNFFDQRLENPIPINDGTYFRFFEEKPGQNLEILVLNGNKVGKKTSEKPHYIFDRKQIIARRTLSLKHVLKSRTTALNQEVRCYRMNDKMFKINMNLQFLFTQ